MLRILICGGRKFHDYNRIKQALADLGGREKIETIIHGGANGADILGGNAAWELGIPSQSVPADWNKYGRAAGPIRNQKMLDECAPNLVLAFPDPKSRGTWDMVRRAKKAGVKVEVF